MSKVFKFSQSLCTSKANRIDNIPTNFLKIAAPMTSYSLTKLFNMAILTETFPHEWKIAKLASLHKMGPRN